MDPGRKDPALAELVQGDHPVWVGGGEPTLRGDLPELLETLGDRLQGLCTDGWALARPQVVADLQNRGLSAVRIPFHSATASAHDWLAGTPGAHKLAWQALRTCVEAGLEVDAEVVVTRPTLLHLDSTIGVLARLNLHGIVLRSLDGDTPDFPALAARWPLVRGPLERALVIAGQAGRTIWLEGIPTCAVEAQDALRTPGRPQDGRPCASCAGPPDCSGIPPAYLAAFGWQDLPRGPSRTDVVTVAILPDEATRTARHRLVEAATTEATTLRLLGLDHPEGADLLAERIFQCPVRLAAPPGTAGIGERVASPIYSTAVGLALMAADDGTATSGPAGGRGLAEGRFDSVAGRMREWFQTLCE